MHPIFSFPATECPSSRTHVFCVCAVAGQSGGQLGNLRGNLENNPCWWDPSAATMPFPANQPSQPFLQLEAFKCSFALQMMPSNDMHVGFRCAKLKLYDVRSAVKGHMPSRRGELIDGSRVMAVGWICEVTSSELT
eukprot:scaffold270759_cov15-Tisochrysis_lutea.AAC.1